MHAVSGTESKAKGVGFASGANRPFSPLRKRPPHILLFGHGDACPQLRRLAEMLRPHARITSYLSDGPNEHVSEPQIMSAIDDAELLLFGPNTASCDPLSAASFVETMALRKACTQSNPLPIVFVIGNRPALNAAHVHLYGEFCRLVVADSSDDTGALVDIFPAATQITSAPEDLIALVAHINQLSRPSLSV